MPQINTGTGYFVGATPVQKLYAGATQVWPSGPPPTLIDITPDNMLHLDAATTLTATGSDFIAGCVLQIKGTGNWVNIAASTVVSDTTMTGSVDMPPGNYSVRVIDAQGRPSNELPFQGLHNTPTLSSISPSTIYYQDGPQRLTFTGTNFYGAGSGYTGLHLFTELPGNFDWADRGQLVVTSPTSAYADGVDPTTLGNWNVRVGYDNPNTTRSGVLVLPVTNKPVTVTSVSGFVDQWMGGTVTITGTGFSGGTMTLAFGDNGGWCYDPLGPFNCTVTSDTQATCSPSWHGGIVTIDSHHDCTVTVNGTAYQLTGQSVGF